MQKSLSLLVLGAVASLVTSALPSATLGASIEPLVIESIRCVGGKANDELIQEQIGNVGQRTSRSYVESLMSKFNGPDLAARAYAESTSKLVVVLRVDGADDGLCRNGGQKTDIIFALKK